jgi:hypothetical protein
MAAPIASWLRETREAQRRPSDGQPWSQDDFLEALEADTGWRLHRPNYSGYETGRSTPSPATLARLVAFWAGRGVAAPDFNAPPEPVPTFEDRILLEMRLAREATERQTRVLATILSRLGGLTPADEELVAAALSEPQSERLPVGVG